MPRMLPRIAGLQGGLGNLSFGRWGAVTPRFCREVPIRNFIGFNTLSQEIVWQHSLIKTDTGQHTGRPEAR